MELQHPVVDFFQYYLHKNFYPKSVYINPVPELAKACKIMRQLEGMWLWSNQVFSYVSFKNLSIESSSVLLNVLPGRDNVILFKGYEKGDILMHWDMFDFSSLFFMAEVDRLESQALKKLEFESQIAI